MSNNNSEKKKILPNIISLGPYYPWNDFKTDKNRIANLKYPVFSDILLNSKTGKLYNVTSDFIIKARKEQLRILSNFYANYLKMNNFSFNQNKIIPVPSKPKYTFNNIEIICQEFEKNSKAQTECGIVRRISNTSKSYDAISRNHKFNDKKILLIDDIFTNGTTRDIIWSKLKQIGCKNMCMITLGKTDHNIYEYNE